MDETKEAKKVTLPLLVTRGLFVFPHLTETIDAGREFSKKAIELSRNENASLLFVTAQKDPSQDQLTAEGIYEIGTICRITGFTEKTGSYQIRVIGSHRATLSNIRLENGSFVADGFPFDEETADAEEENRLRSELMRAIGENQRLLTSVPKSAIVSFSRATSSSELIASLAAYLPLEITAKAAILAESSVNEELKKLIAFLNEQKEMAEIDDKLNQTVRERAEQNQKEYFLREKMKAIKDELGEGDETLSAVDKIKERLEKNPYPENVKSKVRGELRRYQMMPESSLESSLIINYIETLLNVPWYEKSEDNDDLKNVRKILDEDHYGLEKVKKRIVEYIAVKKQTGSLKAPILCFFGPPGCGKTSLARSIARALGRKFVKSSLGGVSDEAEIRGHRRTYVGALPGRIIQGMTKAGTVNPVFLLDEIDKIGGSNYKGDPSSAMLEVLDPEQNFAFNDNFIEEPYDLSNVLFIATANYLENIPGPLRDRLELIEVPSYTFIEKEKIAHGFLIKKQMEANGLKPEQAQFTDDAVDEIIDSYTREAGVRQLERLIASCCRKAVVDLLSGAATPIVIDKEKVKSYLGVEIFEDTKKEKEPQVGVVTGLAYTEFGGDILPIEATYFKGKGGLVLTGKLGDVMKESCSIAVDYVRANAAKYGIPDQMFAENDIHIHFPEGAVPKDGPSAGVAITTAIVSCLTHRKVDNNVAMTGEVTLRGNALPIGGLREKSLAALRSGIKTIIVPYDNKKDVSELPEEVKNNLKIVFMKKADDAIDLALLPSEESKAA